MLFATPPTSTYDEALALFVKAEQIQPDFYKTNKLFLAKTYLRLNRPDEVRLLFVEQFGVVDDLHFDLLFTRSKYHCDLFSNNLMMQAKKWRDATLATPSKSLDDELADKEAKVYIYSVD